MEGFGSVLRCREIPCYGAVNSLFGAKPNLTLNAEFGGISSQNAGARSHEIGDFPCFFAVYREFSVDTGSITTVHTTNFP